MPTPGIGCIVINPFWGLRSWQPMYKPMRTWVLPIQQPMVHYDPLQYPPSYSRRGVGTVPASNPAACPSYSGRWLSTVPASHPAASNPPTSNRIVIHLETEETQKEYFRTSDQCDVASNKSVHCYLYARPEGLCIHTALCFGRMLTTFFVFVFSQEDLFHICICS